MFLFIIFSDIYESVFPGKKKKNYKVLLVELYESYGQLKTHTMPTY